MVGLGCKVVLAGSENDDPEFTKLIEGCGAEVVCDRHCYGAVESRAPIVVKDGEKPLTAIMPRDFGYPVCSIEKEYINGASGQLRTRFQAFVESIEIKKIQEGK